MVIYRNMRHQQYKARSFFPLFLTDASRSGPPSIWPYPSLNFPLLSSHTPACCSFEAPHPCLIVDELSPIDLHDVIQLLGFADVRYVMEGIVRMI